MSIIHLDSDGVKKIIPHRDPKLFIDEADVESENQKAKGIFILETRPYLFDGHFPGRPVLPGIYLVEAMAQLAAVVALQLNPDFIDQPFFFSGIDNVKFRRTVLPADKFASIEVEIVHQKISSQRAFVKISGVAYIGYDLASQAVFTGIGMII